MDAQSLPAVAPAEPVVGERAVTFGRRSDISARSVLVTIFGDAIVPAGGEIWLGDLIDLCAPFGFSDRLVRTSMFRLTSEDWFETERVGRRSRYRLTTSAIDEFAAAEARIYHLPHTEWDGSWTVVFNAASLDRRAQELLRWRGFGPLAPGVLAHPQVPVNDVRRIVERSDARTDVPIAEARFQDLAPLVGADRFLDDFGLREAALGYRRFMERYEWASALETERLSGRDAFVVRTMVVHDLRRARLADPDLPGELAPDAWPAPDAMALASAIYAVVAERADSWLHGFDGLHPSPTHVAERFR